eukprot:3760756-Rhodomonas_salina.2
MCVCGDARSLCQDSSEMMSNATIAGDTDSRDPPLPCPSCRGLEACSASMLWLAFRRRQAPAETSLRIHARSLTTLIHSQHKHGSIPSAHYRKPCATSCSIAHPRMREEPQGFEKGRTRAGGERVQKGCRKLLKHF